MNDMLTQGINASFKSGSLDLDQICQAWVVTIQSRHSTNAIGYIEGQNLVAEYLNPEKQAEGVPGAIRELLCRKVDNIVAPYESTVKAASTVVLICINDDLSARFNRKT